MKINVLGTEYEVLKCTNIEDVKLNECDGYIDATVKKIVVMGQWANHTMSMEAQNVNDDRILRHEITHAFLYESGLYGDSGLGRNELLVDWIALQMPKMVRAMARAGCLEMPERSKK